VGDERYVGVKLDDARLEERVLQAIAHFQKKKSGEPEDEVEPDNAEQAGSSAAPVQPLMSSALKRELAGKKKVKKPAKNKVKKKSMSYLERYGLGKK
jgi:hypothetical protein